MKYNVLVCAVVENDSSDSWLQSFCYFRWYKFNSGTQWQFSFNINPWKLKSLTRSVLVTNIVRLGVKSNKVYWHLRKYRELGKNVCMVPLIFTVYPKKYAHGFCFAVLCCGYTLTDFTISTRLTSLALWQSNDCPSAGNATLMNMDKYFMWNHYERLHNHNKAKHNKTVCILIGIYCRYAWVGNHFSRLYEMASSTYTG